MRSFLNRLVAFNPLDLPRRTKSILVIVTDITLLPISLWAAFNFRLGILDPRTLYDASYMLSIILLSIASLAVFRLYRLKLIAFDMFAVARLAAFSFTIVAIAGLVDFFGAAAMYTGPGLPRSVPLLYGATFFWLAIMVRMIVLQILLRFEPKDDNKIPVAIYGAGSAGIQLALALKQSRELSPVCFIDDSLKLQGLIISSLHVHSSSELKKMVDEGRIKRILLAMPSMSTADRVKLVSRLSALGCEIQVVPSYVDLISGRSMVSDLRSVTPDDLLGRDLVDLDIPEVAKTYTNRNIMVTGAGGSIGSELCRQLLSCRPNKIILFERSEHALYEIDRELSALNADNKVDIVRYLGSVTDVAAVKVAMQQEDVEVVLHAAAYKHVPLVEENEVEGARNNILGTLTVAEAAQEKGVERFILISTDKAVRPTNVMGATKRLAELVVQDIQSRNSDTKFSMVRFGNVLGSSGSVVPLFNKQIAKGGPVTVTDKNITRYFMTIPEASRLVLLAGSYWQSDGLFVLDMGKPVKIVDLARKMIELAGKSVRDGDNPDGDIEIKFLGLRPGEKLYEELLIDEDARAHSPHHKIFKVHEKSLSKKDYLQMVKRLRKAIAERQTQEVRSVLCDFVEGFGDKVEHNK